uniref:Uncharacterized protein n=1 Tax=viral metagenome TaxID=1070528 RepID=A0A6C0CK56_9ZZZZ
MYGSRKREEDRKAMMAKERESENALNHVKRTYSELQTQRAMLPQHESQLQALEARMKQCKGASSIREFFNLQTEVRNLKRKISDIDTGCDAKAFYERAVPLITQTESSDPNVNQKREALALVLFHKEKTVPVFIQTDLCTTCKEELTMKAEESLMVCPKCRKTWKLLNMATDHVDVDYFAQDTHLNHTKFTSAGNIDSSDDALYPKPLMFEGFISQFSETVPDPPPRVLEIILCELSRVHIASGSKIQPTPIGMILRKKGLKEYVWMSLRISMILKRNGDDAIPSFSNDIIQRLMKRFHLFINAVKESVSKKQLSPNLKTLKTMTSALKFITRNFMQFLTRVFLIMEGDVAQSELFECHKTRSVHRREDRRIQHACERLQKKGDLEGFDWNYVRSL